MPGWFDAHRLRPPVWEQSLHAERDRKNQEIAMANEKGPNVKKKQTCKNCEGKGLVKKGDRVMKCQRCKGTGVR
jgi:DnaJ-class molecular chaperone